MAKRGGKAATRRQRQRATAKPASPRPVARPAAPPAPATAEPETATSTSAVTATPAVSVPTTPPRSRPSLPSGLSGSSRLTEKAMAEYHYVRMDLRNIGVLSLVLLALLGVAYVVVNVLGIGKQI